MTGRVSGGEVSSAVGVRGIHFSEKLWLWQPWRLSYGLNAQTVPDMRISIIQYFFSENTNYEIYGPGHAHKNYPTLFSENTNYETYGPRHVHKHYPILFSENTNYEIYGPRHAHKHYPTLFSENTNYEIYGPGHAHKNYPILFLREHEL